MKTKAYNIDFLRDKVERAGTALCTFHHPSFYINTHIVHTARIDEQGNLWFRLVHPVSRVATDLQSFAITLNFYKKKLGYSLRLDALATAIEENGILYVRACISNSQYADVAGEATMGFWANLQQQFSKIAASLLF